MNKTTLLSTAAIMIITSAIPLISHPADSEATTFETFYTDVYMPVTTTLETTEFYKPAASRVYSPFLPETTTKPVTTNPNRPIVTRLPLSKTTTEATTLQVTSTSAYVSVSRLPSAPYSTEETTITAETTNSYVPMVSQLPLSSNKTQLMEAEKKIQELEDEIKRLTQENEELKTGNVFDVDNNGSVNVADLIELKRYLVLR